MGIYSVLSLLAFIVYLCIGIYTFNLDKKSRLNKLFLLWCLSMATWSAAYSVVYQISDPDNSWQGYFWVKISAIGWCSFSSIILHLSMLITENEKIKQAKTKILIYLPSIVFFLTTVIFFRPGYKTPAYIGKFFYTGDFLYNFSFLLACILLIFLWGRKSKDIRKIKQSFIICVSSIIPFVLNLTTQIIFPLMGIKPLPSIGQIYTLIMVFGVYYVIRRYRLFNVSTDCLVDEILSNMVDLFVLLAPDGKITRVSKSTEKLLKYNEGEIIGKNIDNVIKERSFIENISSYRDRAITLKYEKLDCMAKDGSIVAISGTCSFIVDDYLKDVLGIAIVGHDIILMQELQKEIEEHKETEKQLQESQERLIHLAYHDSLTDLPNRKYFYERLFIELKKAKRIKNKFAIFFLDLDGFKKVNDSYGHEMGDYLLCEVAGRLKGCIRESDEAARIGGDEFTLLITGVHSMEDALIVKDKINSVLRLPVKRGNVTINTGASIGISIYPEDGEDVDTLINKADNKMYSIKNSKRQM